MHGLRVTEADEAGARHNEAYELDRLAEALLRAREHCIALDDRLAAYLLDMLLLHVAQRLVAVGFPLSKDPPSPPSARAAPRRTPHRRSPSRGMRCTPRRS